MCGIVGFSATTAINDHPKSTQLYWALRELMIDVTTRGTDAGGYMGVTPDSRTIVSKNEGPLFNLEHLDEDMMQSQVFIAHARLATHGDEKDNINNHPFVSKDGRLGLIHNGVVSNYNKYSDANIGDCDSESILRQIEHAKGKTLSKRIRNGVTPLIGTMACALVDALNPNILYLFRSGGGNASPLHTVKLPGITFFASTWEMLYRACVLAKLEFKTIVKEEDDQIIIINNQRSQRISIPGQPAYSQYGTWHAWENYEWDDGKYGDSAVSSRHVSTNKGATSLYIIEGTSMKVPIMPFQMYWMGDTPFIPARSALDSDRSIVLYAGKSGELY